MDTSHERPCVVEILASVIFSVDFFYFIPLVKLLANDLELVEAWFEGNINLFVREKI